MSSIRKGEKETKNKQVLIKTMLLKKNILKRERDEKELEKDEIKRVKRSIYRCRGNDFNTFQLTISQINYVYIFFEDRMNFFKLL